ncbi:MAG: hypothetical protein Q4C36_06950 [Coriobacteriia bacterium]|nr:hypothetical protein [Coriobacteriia bacterium]
MNIQAIPRQLHIVPVAIAALSLFLVFMAVTCVATPQEAIANSSKHALPTIRKHVSTGGAFADTVTAMPGQSLTYRIVLTMPEDVASRDALSYAVIDEPDAAITPSLALSEARIVDNNGATKAHVDPNCRLDGTRLRIDLGNLRDTGAELAFGDRVVIEYPAMTSSSIEPGAHRNVAQLLYDDGSGWNRSAKVMACVNAIASGSRVKNTDNDAAYIANPPKTGDGRMAFATPAAIAALSAVALAMLARRQQQS